MRSTSRRAVVVTALVAIPMLGSSPAQAVPTGTPAGTGGGCQENGQAVSGNASVGGVGFGQFVSTQTPIANDVAGFFTSLCADDRA